MTSGDHGKDSASQIDGQVGIGVRIGLVAGTEGIQHGLAEGIAKDGQDHRRADKHGEGVVHDLLRPFRFSGTPGNGAQRRAAGGKKVAESGDQGHDGKDQAHAGQGQTGCPGQVAQVDPVHHII